MDNPILSIVRKHSPKNPLSDFERGGHEIAKRIETDIRALTPPENRAELDEMERRAARTTDTSAGTSTDTSEAAPGGWRETIEDVRHKLRFYVSLEPNRVLDMVAAQLASPLPEDKGRADIAVDGDIGIAISEHGQTLKGRAGGSEGESGEPTTEWWNKRCAWYNSEIERLKADLASSHTETKRWYKAAMDSGVVVCAEGKLWFSTREERDTLRTRAEAAEAKYEALLRKVGGSDAVE